MQSVAETEEFRSNLTPGELELFDDAWRASLATESAYAKEVKSMSKAPSWLDPSLEITSPNETHFTPGEFAVTLVPLILSIDPSISADRAFELAAHFAGETGYGRHFRGNNLGGVKINQSLIRSYTAAHGTPPRWWSAAGHIAQGDAPTVYYMGYPSLTVFLTDWLARFVPRHGTAPKSRYARTGELFWDPASAPGNWFRAMLDAGYRGDTTDTQKEGSMQAFRSITNRLKVLFGQQTIGAAADGAWGPRSRQLAAQWQQQHGLAASGELDDATLSKMVGAQVHAKSFGATTAKGAVVAAATLAAGYALFKSYHDSKKR